ncbi:hypothetical protein ACF08M_05830 [Streptomyces sp. NPDC015032]|uniref:hypothetical protein n=1 Tax=Streptomyces sp. NPDC015032 TaxID=3364937 RepID=UPI0036F5D851
MDTIELRSLVTSCISNGTLTMAASTLRTGAAARLINDWFSGPLVVENVTCTDTDTGIQVKGTLNWTRISCERQATATFAAGPGGDPSLLLRFPLPDQWTFAASFPATAGTPMNGLRFPAGPELLLTSQSLSAQGGHPVLARGLNFHAPAAELHTDCRGWNALLTAASDGRIALSGTIAPFSGATLPDIQLASGPLTSPSQDLDLRFSLQAGAQYDDGEVTFYGVDLCASLGLPGNLSLKLITALAPGPLTLIAQLSSTNHSVRSEDLKTWAHLGAAFERGAGSGLDLGATVQLRDLTLSIDPLQLSKQFTHAVTQITVGVAAQPELTWIINGAPGLRLAGLQANFVLDNPLRKTRKATVYAGADVQIAGHTNVMATGVIPPGTLRLALDPSTPVELTEAFKQFVPGQVLVGLPRIDLTGLDGQITPTKGAFEVTARAAVAAPFDLGAATITLKDAKVSLWRRPGAAGGEPTTGGEFTATARLAPRSDLAACTDFTADWTIPGRLTLKGTLPELPLTTLLKHLDTEAGLLPDSLPEVTLIPSTVTVALAKENEQSYDLLLDSGVRFKNTTLRLVGKAGKDGATTAFTAVLWAEGWGVSPAAIAGWKGPLGIFDAVTFTGVGLAVSTAEQQLTSLSDVSLPATLPDQVSKGLTFFAEMTFTKDGFLNFLNKLFPGATGVKVAGVLATDASQSHFDVTIAEGSRKPGESGFGGVHLVIYPAVPSIALVTTFVLHAPFISDDPLQFIVSGSVSRTEAVWSMSLNLVLRGADSEGGRPGLLMPCQLGFALDAPGPAVITATPTAPVVRPLPVTADADAKKHALRDVFGIKGFTIHDFFLNVSFRDNGFGLGGGGCIEIGGVTLELAVHGTVEPPDIDAFVFSLDATHTGHGVSLHDLLGLVFDDIPGALDFLKDIAIKKLALYAVAIPGGWTNLGTQKEWSQGITTDGDIDFFGNTWRFQASVGKEGIAAKSDIAQPLRFADILTVSDASGKKGPQFEVNLRKTGNSFPEKILHLSGSISFLDVVKTKAEIDVNHNGFSFAVTIDITIAKASFDCVLHIKHQKLTAKANAELDFRVGAPDGWDVAFLDVRAAGDIEVTASLQGASVSVHLTGHLTAPGVEQDVTIGPLNFTAQGFNEIGTHLQDSVDIAKNIWKQLENLGTEAGKCAVDKASRLM